MRIGIGSDHAGYEYKQIILDDLRKLGHEGVDFGTHSSEPVDYPDFIVPVARAVTSGECDRGIVLGGSGNGEAMAANKVHGIRCALCWNEMTAELSRRHNDANVLSLGQAVPQGSSAVTGAAVQGNQTPQGNIQQGTTQGGLQQGAGAPGGTGAQGGATGTAQPQ